MTPAQEALRDLLLAAVAGTSDPLLRQEYREDAKLVASQLPPETEDPE